MPRTMFDRHHLLTIEILDTVCFVFEVYFFNFMFSGPFT